MLLKYIYIFQYLDHKNCFGTGYIMIIICYVSARRKSRPMPECTAIEICNNNFCFNITSNGIKKTSIIYA